MEPSLGQLARQACLWEVTARKPGNVHRHRDLPGLPFTDFLASANAIAPIFDSADRQRVGRTVVYAIRATRAVVNTNTNLGIVLLLAPLAAVPASQDLRSGVARILDGLNIEDSRDVFAAIRIASPGGLGEVDAEDVTRAPTLPLRQVMALAAVRDLVARQYANGFQEVLGIGLSALLDGLNRFDNLEDAIVFAHLTLMAHYPDSLIARKRGVMEAELASRGAQQVLAAGWPHTPMGRHTLEELDSWLTEPGKGRNPGTSADLVTACLFAGQRENSINSQSWLIPI